MKIREMLKLAIPIISMAVLYSCTSNEQNKDDMKLSHEEVVDSLMYYRHGKLKTDFLARRFPDLGRDEAAGMQLDMLQRELTSGETLAGWKMGGTVGDSTSFDPIMGFMLKKDEHHSGDVISISEFPGREIMIEGEVGFVFNRDFPEGVESIEALKEGIDYVVGAVEFAQSNAKGVNGDSNSLITNHVLAFGTGQVGYLLGEKQVSLSELDLENETVECFVNDQSAAIGGSSNIYMGHLNALYALVNLLPKYKQMIKEGEVVITGSMYKNPTITSASEISLHFKTLGDISLSIVD